MNKKTYSQILDDVAHDQIPADLDLAPQILSQIQKRKGTIMQPRVRTLVTIIMILLVLVVMSVGVTAVSAAIQRWFGYLPDFGLVRDGNIRVLSEPDWVTQEGFTLAVEQATTSSDKTIVKYTLGMISEGILAESYFCRGQDLPVMRLPDGSELKASGLGTNTATIPWYEFEASFGPVPADINAVTLIINCVSGIQPDQVPQHWEAALQFVPAPPEMTIAPVLDVPPSLEPASTEPSSPRPASTEPSASLPGLELTQIIPMENGYIMAGRLAVATPLDLTVDEFDGYLEDVTITDTNGLEVAYGSAPDDFMPDGMEQLPEGTFSWACQIQGESFNWPLTMMVHSVTALTAPYPPAEFQFDAGPQPQGGQVWMLNQDVAMGPKTVHVVSVKRVQKSDHGFDGYEFIFGYDPSAGFSLEIQGYTSMGGGGAGPDPDGTFSRALAYPDGVPSGMLTIILNGYGVVKLPGPWQVTWDAPAGPGDAAPTP